MVIGNGLIAKQFKGTWEDKNALIFASGVSNSREKNSSAYNREKSLLKSFELTNKLFVYFSTCSLYDLSLKDSTYIKHKIEMEEIIKMNFKNYLILRLPILIGVTENPYTLFNFFFNSMVSGKKISIIKYAVRYILDVEEIEPVIRYIYNNKKEWNKTINMFIDRPMQIPKIIQLMEKFSRLKANKKIIDAGISYKVPKGSFNRIKLKIFSNIEHNGYSERIIKKYVDIKLQSLKKVDI